mmetsp:Transcript_117962/g.205357  ORF Transcript_117962/g.205357 Transcript_117962/m.205357 type:complete len:275 (-) Transcript_117962:234-1058(-)
MLQLKGPDPVGWAWREGNSVRRVWHQVSSPWDARTRSQRNLLSKTVAVGAAGIRGGVASWGSYGTWAVARSRLGAEGSVRIGYCLEAVLAFRLPFRWVAVWVQLKTQCQISPANVSSSSSAGQLQRGEGRSAWQLVLHWGTSGAVLVLFSAAKVCPPPTCCQVIEHLPQLPKYLILGVGVCNCLGPGLANVAVGAELASLGPDILLCCGGPHPIATHTLPLPSGEVCSWHDALRRFGSCLALRIPRAHPWASLSLLVAVCGLGPGWLLGRPGSN